MKKYFGTDGIRGQVNKDITSSLFNRIGQSMSYLHAKKIYIGYDTRVSNKLLYHSLASGALSVGINCIDLGIISTPALAYYSYTKKAVCLMITASHNLYTDNGVKIFINGYKLNDSDETLLEYAIDEKATSSATIGKSYVDNYSHLDYLNFINNFIYRSSKKIALDFANGSLYSIGKSIYNKVSDNLIIIGDRPNGTNINHLLGATNPTYLQKICQEHNCDIGFCFDGDGDRIVAMDKEKIYYGNELIYIIAKYLKEKKRLKNNKVVLTKTTNLGIINSFKKQAIDVELVETGDKYVLETLLKHNLSLGGENSGHIILLDYLITGDGLLNSLIILYLCDYFKASLAELTADLMLYPEKMLNIETNNKSIIANNEIQDYIIQFNQTFSNDGYLNIRASGTENLIRIYICHKDQLILDQKVKEIYLLINSLLEKEE